MSRMVKKAAKTGKKRGPKAGPAEMVRRPVTMARWLDSEIEEIAEAAKTVGESVSDYSRRVLLKDARKVLKK